jgi:hypothetical protein
MALVCEAIGVNVCQPVIAYYPLGVIILRGKIKPAEAGWRSRQGGNSPFPVRDEIGYFQRNRRFNLFFVMIGTGKAHQTKDNTDKCHNYIHGAHGSLLLLVVWMHPPYHIYLTTYVGKSFCFGSAKYELKSDQGIHGRPGNCVILTWLWHVLIDQVVDIKTTKQRC